MQFEYDLENEEMDVSRYFLEDGALPFNPSSKRQMQIMMEEVFLALNLQDEYSAKKLEMILKYELPTFTANRRLVKNWILENFIF